MILSIFKTMAYISQVMKDPIVHPEDSITTFLSQIYATLTNETVIRGCISKSELPKLNEYESISRTNSIARFNFERLYNEYNAIFPE